MSETTMPPNEVMIKFNVDAAIDALNIEVGMETPFSSTTRPYAAGALGCFKIVTSEMESKSKDKEKIMLCSGFAPLLTCGVRFLHFQRRFQTAFPSCEVMVQTPIHSSRRLFFSRYYSLLPLSIFAYLYALSISACTPVSIPAENPLTLTYHIVMASSSTNPNPITALDDEDSLEFFPRLHPTPDAQDLEQAVDQFLHVDSPHSSPNPRISTHSAQVVSSSSTEPPPNTATTHATPLFPVRPSAPIITDSISVSTNIDKSKGKAPMIVPTTRTSRKDSGLVINDSCPPCNATIPSVSPTLLHSIPQSQAFVSFFLNDDSTWNTRKLKHYFPPYQVDRILTTPIDPQSSDSLIWGFHSSGILTESVSHALIGCPRAKSIWKASSFKQFYLSYYRSDIKDFLLQNTRNSILFKKNHTTNNVEEFVVNYLQEYKDAQHSQQHDSQPSEDSNIPQSSHQLRPPSLSPETPALFVDAATDQLKSLTGAGFVFKRGHQTVLASNFSKLLGVVSPIFSEGQALLQSLNWCIDSQFTPQVVFSDCLNLVSKVNGDWQDNSALSGLVSRIRLLFSNFPGASLQFIPRQFNMEAHNCAREALRFREMS
ncbi:hypothetical protein G4B88_014767 [Cannabis sativa]|uniref:RNase H type-1 domain-containing protein n=1 Tax=Cannabis sativa TaxID=3483 RepID=A0A7J6IB64_CANSA|nr:hypothetical protein G4B88_014767 [Cannabis sativa]